ncbi:hypothetical protein Tcan_11904 [Toxocara canis]|uniref:Uncharacterized protein n=1 Tax=Toxocara canis TaxID=6265 RepID=A0A0B2VCM6_TOXCA|nr:hypothetical protein Tcan_11904 [Toxocara canis]
MRDDDSEGMRDDDSETREEEMDVDQSERKIFTAAYISSVGDLTDSINQQELYEIIVAAGKDLQRTDLNQRMKSGEEEINFSEAFHIYGNIARIDLEAIFERIDAQRSGHVQLNKLLTRLRKRCDISEEEKEELCGYFVSMAERGSIPWRNDTYTEGSLFNDPVNEPD